MRYCRHVESVPLKCVSPGRPLRLALGKVPRFVEQIKNGRKMKEKALSVFVFEIKMSFLFARNFTSFDCLMLAISQSGAALRREECKRRRGGAGQVSATPVRLFRG